jgi:hypothetical protein
VSSAALLLCALGTVGLNWFASDFEPTRRLLARSSWGAGTPSSTYATAFATLRPWWFEYAPEAVRTTDSGGLEPVVRVPRTAVRETGDLVLPARGVGYYAILGGLTAVRSLFSNELIFDFGLAMRIQRWLLLLALGAVPLVLWLVHPDFRRTPVVLGYAAAWLPVLFLWPNRRGYLPEGIVDSSMASACAIVGLIAFLVLVHDLRLQSRTSKVRSVLAAVFLSFCALVRGEFLPIFAFALVWLGLLHLRDRSRWRGIILACCLLPVFPVANGLVNRAVFGHFVPLRIQSGQNLYEPIGQFPNPYGIRYDDEWLSRHLADFGLPYFGFETDRFLTRRYLDLLRENPGLFVKNFARRLDFFSAELGVLLDAWTILPVVLLVSFLSWRDPRFLYVAIPLVMAIGYLLFFGWFNRLLRCVAPAHFLINLFFCGAAAFVVAVALEKLERVRPRRFGLLGSPDVRTRH